MDTDQLFIMQRRNIRYKYNITKFITKKKLINFNSKKTLLLNSTTGHHHHQTNQGTPSPQMWNNAQTTYMTTQGNISWLVGW